jgi:hypothetical protein
MSSGFDGEQVLHAAGWGHFLIEIDRNHTAKSASAASLE